MKKVEKEEVPMLEAVVETLMERVGKLEAKEDGTSAIVSDTKSNYDSVPTDTFEFKKATYKFLVSGIFHEGQKITAAEAVEDEALLALFVETYPKTVEKINL